MPANEITSAELAELGAKRDRLRQAETRANSALDLLSHREDEAAAAQQAVRRAEERLQRANELEDWAAAEYRAALEAAGYVDTATGPVPAPAGYLYTIVCCGRDLDICAGETPVCPLCGTTFSAGGRHVAPPAVNAALNGRRSEAQT